MATRRRRRQKGPPMKTIPPAELEQLIALQARHQQLLAMLPAGVNDFADLPAAEFAAKLADIELVTAEMMVINAAGGEIPRRTGGSGVKGGNASRVLCRCGSCGLARGRRH